METVYDFIFNNSFFIILFLVGLIFGRMHEKSHLRDLDKNEKILGHIIVSSERFYRPKIAEGSQGELVQGSVVIAQDYFKMIIASILNVFGMNLVTYETLLDRARREALVRMRREAEFKGYNQIFGIRLDVTTLNVSGSMVEAIAYGTAVYTVDNPKIPPALPRVE